MRKIIGKPEDHVRELMEEAEKYHPGYKASLREEDILIYAMEVKTTSYCTLRCRDCTHLIPYTKTPAHMPASDLCADLEKILSVAKIAGLIFMGGEIMIYPELAKLMELYQQSAHTDRVGFVRVTTNGTVLPSDEFCEAFRKIPNGYVTISDYGDLSSRKTEAAKKLESYGIAVTIIPDTQEWMSLGGYERRNYTEDDVKALYRKCHGKLYLHLYRDHLYHCYRAPIMNEDGLIPHSESDYLDIASLREEELAEELPKFMKDFPYAQSCYYCSGFHEDSPSVPRALQR